MVTSSVPRKSYAVGTVRYGTLRLLTDSVLEVLYLILFWLYKHVAETDCVSVVRFKIERTRMGTLNVTRVSIRRQA
jgi:hypothetical protein